MKSPREAYLACLECLGADTLTIAWIKNRTRFDSEIVTSREAGDRYNFLATKNCEGHCIYCRPWHPSPQLGRYVLCDDLRRENVGPALAAGARCIVETSPGSIQAWFSLPTRVDTHALKRVALFLASKWGGDLRAAANPTQFGRFPGFTNRKPKHAGSSKSKSGFPLARLLHAKKGVILEPQILMEATGECSHVPISRAFPQNDGLDRSRADFHTACSLLERGHSESQVFEHLMLHSQKRPGDLDYCRHTAGKAAIHTGLRIRTV